MPGPENEHPLAGAMISIELHHIDRNCRAVTGNTFPVRWSEADGEVAADILASRTVTGSEADDLAELFRRAFQFVPDLNLCGHYPNYGVRCFRGDRVFETTICLSCANWIGVTRAGPGLFCIAGDVFPGLSSALRGLLPLPAGEVARIIS